MKTHPSFLRNVRDVVLGALLLCVPAFLNRSPLLFSDSRSYYVGGRMVVDRIVALVHHLTSHADAAGMAAAAPVHAKAVRSIYYSVLSYLLASNGTLWALIAVQALLTVWVIRASLYTFRCDGRRLALLNVLLLLTLFSTLPWVVSFFMPDLFAGMMVLSLACLVLAWDDLGRWSRTALLTIFAACIAMHQTNLPIAVALTLVAMAMQWRSLLGAWPRWIGVGSATGLAIVAMLAVGVVGFGKWSISPLNPPFLLARSIEDGPGRLYLRAHCPQINLVMCHHLDRLDVNDDDFLWHENGVFSVVSPEEQDAIRREDSRIAIAAGLEYPWLQAKASIANFFDQLTLFDLRDVRFPNSARLTTSDMSSDIHQTFPPWLIAWSVSDYIAVVASCLGLGWAWITGRLMLRDKQLAVLAVLAVLLNAFTGIMSMPASRYGARMMWLLPLAATLLVPCRMPAARGAASTTVTDLRP